MRINCITFGARHRSKYSDKKLDEARAKLAHIWSQTIDQVTEEEAEWYLDGGNPTPTNVLK